MREPRTRGCDSGSRNKGSVRRRRQARCPGRSRIRNETYLDDDEDELVETEHDMKHERGHLETGLNEMENPAEADAAILTHLARSVDVGVGYESGSGVLDSGKALGGDCASPEGDIQRV